MKGFTQQGVDIGEKVGDWLCRKGGRVPVRRLQHGRTRIAAAQEQAREATQAAMDQASADAAAATTAEGETVAAATPATPSVSVAGFELPPEFVEYLQGLIAGGASSGDIQAALHEKGVPVAGEDMVSLFQQMIPGVTPAEGEATTTGPGGDVTLAEAQERELTLRDVAGLRIQTAIIEQLIVTSSPVPIETVLQTIPWRGRRGGVYGGGISSAGSRGSGGGTRRRACRAGACRGRGRCRRILAVTVEGRGGRDGCRARRGR